MELLAFIRQARSLGLSLESITEIAGLAERGAMPCERTDALLTQRLTEIDDAIADLQHLRHAITRARERPRARSGIRCAVIESVGA